MKISTTSQLLVSILFLSAVCISPPLLFAQGTAFTYQGRLSDGGVPADGSYDLSFSLYDLDVGGMAVAGPLTNSPVIVSNGLFTVTLDFGPGVFNGTTYWLEIGARTNGVGTFTLLSPRQEITPTPYAIFAETANLGSNSVDTTHIIDGQVMNADLADNSVTSAKIVDGAVNTFDILDGGIFRVDLNPLARYSLDAQDGSPTDVVLVNNAGLVGVGNSAPLYKLDIDGGIFSSVLRLAADSSPLMTFYEGATYRAYMQTLGNDFHLMNYSAGSLYLGSDNNNWMRITSSGSVGILNNNGNSRLILDGDSGGGGVEYIYAADGSLGVYLDGENGGAGYVAVYNSTSGTRVALDGESTGSGGRVSVYDTSGTETVQIIGAESSTQGGQILMRNASGTDTVQLDSDASGNGSGYLRLYKSDGSATITLQADYAGDGRIITQEIQITGGSDLSEQFDVATLENELLPGTVVCIDPQHIGHLTPSTKPYDRTVAGVISGAGGIKPGMLMGQHGTQADGKHPVALTGRVYVKADASNGPIKPGDLLTTSATPGHAMKVTDHSKANGAILGKAMSGLADGKGMVLLLVSLQ